MKVKKSVKEYFSVRAGKVNRTLNIPVKKLLPDDIHCLRVNIRKIRALVSLSSIAAGKDASKSLKLIKRLFTRAGRLREAQLRARAIQEKNVDNKLSNYLRFLNLCIHYEKRNFKKELELIQEEHGSPLTSLKRQSKKIGKKQIKDFEKKGEKIKQELLSKKQVTSDELHELRKQLKREMYLHEALGDLISFNAGDKKVSHMLGEWNDCQVIAADIKADLKVVKLPASEVKLLKKMTSDYLIRAESLQSLLINKRFNLT